MPGDNATASDYDELVSEHLLGIAADVLRSFGSAFGGKHLAIVGAQFRAFSFPTLPWVSTPTSEQVTGVLASCRAAT